MMRCRFTCYLRTFCGRWCLNFFPTNPNFRFLKGLNSVELGQDGVMPSPEDVAWADSCLSKDPDMFDSGWNSLKDALLETLNAQHHSSPYERENSPEGAKMEIFSSEDTSDVHNSDKAPVSIEGTSEGVEPNDGDRLNHDNNTDDFWSSHKMEDVFLPTYNENLRDLGVSDPEVDLLEIFSSEDTSDVHDSDKSPVSIAATSEGAEPNDGDRLNHENSTDDFWSTHKMEDVFLPTYNENSRDLGVSDPEVDLVFQEFQLEQSTEDIFKIWDFDIPPEENDLMKQLNKALTENSLEPTTSVSDDSETWKGLQDESLDDLISGIADLALSPNSG